jgi:hypothetical protein
MLSQEKYFYTTVSAAGGDFCLKSTLMAICFTIHVTLNIQSQSLELIVSFKYLMHSELHI